MKGVEMARYGIETFANGKYGIQQFETAQSLRGWIARKKKKREQGLGNNDLHKHLISKFLSSRNPVQEDTRKRPAGKAELKAKAKPKKTPAAKAPEEKKSE